jgi:hypothetical protein
MKNKLVKLFICLFLAQGLLTDCTMQKRVHRKGYHVVWSHKQSGEQRKQKNSGVKALASSNRVLEEEAVVFANTDREIDLVFLKKKPTLILNKDACGDSHLLLNAIEKNERALKYKRSDVLNHQAHVQSEARVTHKYTSKFNKRALKLHPKTALIPKISNKPKLLGKVNILGFSSLISLFIYLLAILFVFGYLLTNFSGILFLFILFLSIIPLVMAYVSLFQFKREPNKYTGKWMPIALVCFYLAINLYYVVLATVFAIWGWVPAFIYVAILALFFVLLSVFIAALIPQG